MEPHDGTAGGQRGGHPDDRTDEQLVRAALAGDDGAFVELHRRHLGAVVTLVRTETRHAADIPDLVQEVLTTAWTRLHALRDPGRFRPWLLQIARRAVIDHARRAARRPGLDGDQEHVLHRTPAPQPGPLEQVELLELAERIRAALEDVRAPEALAIATAARTGPSTPELAAALGTTPGNAKVTLHRARRRLETALAGGASAS